jgi:hypothetical protein
MSYQKKTTGDAQHLLHAFMVDPDTKQIVDFANAGVTADMVIGANVTVGTLTWDGNTRDYFQLGSGTTADDFIAFGATKPSWVNNVNGLERTIVVIAEAVGGPLIRAFGQNSSHFVQAHSGSGGSTHPYITGMGFVSAQNGGNAQLSAGDKRIFGFSMKHGGSGHCFAYTAAHDAGAMTKTTCSAPTQTSTSVNFDLDYVGRRDDSTTHQQDKYLAILIFAGADGSGASLPEASWDALRDSGGRSLIEQAADTTAPVLSAPTASVTGQTTATVGATTDEANGVMACVITTSSTAPSTAQIVAGQDHTGSSAVFADDTTISATGANTINVTGLTANTSYYAHLFHEDAAGNDSNVVSSSQFTTLPNAPTAPTIQAETDLANNTVTINWDDNSSNETSFTVQIETPSGAGNWVNAASGAANPTAANVESLAVSGLSSGTQYRARVRASNTGGDSAWSTGSAFTTTSAGGGSTALPKLMQLLN